MRRTLQKLLLAAVGPMLLVGAPRLAHADDIDKLGGTVIELEARVRKLEGGFAGTRGDTPDPQAADRALIDAQVFYELKNYDSAATRCLDILDKYKESQVYPEAVYLLADSLFQLRNFFTSRRYFEQIVEVGPSQPRYQDALQRLIELSLYTGDYTPVDGYLAKLAELPPGKQRPSVPYVKGKYYYFRQKYDLAEKAFADIKVGHIYWFHSRYFLGAGLVAQGKLVEGIDQFEEILRAEAKTDSQKRIVELAHMALGRIYYDRGRFTNSFNEYAKISERSDLFPDALYEQAWVSIKGKEYRKAFRALDLFLTVRPDDTLAPEVKLLIGNLHLRQDEFDAATASFNKTRDEFEPIKKQMEAKVQGDTSAYFKDIISKNLGKFDTATYLPELAVKWVKADPDVEKVISLTGDVGDLKKSLDDADQIISRLDRALAGSQHINLFPELSDRRANVVEIGNQLNDVRLKLVNAERQYEQNVISPDERRREDELRARRTQLEKQLASLPTDVDSLASRQQLIKSQFNDVDRRASETGVALQSYHANLVAIDSYYHSLLKQNQLHLTPEQRLQNEKDIKAYADLEAEMQAQYKAVRQEIDDAKLGVGVEDQAVAMESQIQQQLKDVLSEEVQLSASIRERLSGDARMKADQIASILERANSADRELTAFNRKIDAAVEARVKDVQAQLADVKSDVGKYRTQLTGYEGETVDVGSGITADSFRNVAQRFYNIVIRADVGIIDVAWAIKKQKTDEGDRLVREEKRELKLIDDEFKSVLKE